MPCIYSYARCESYCRWLRSLLLHLSYVFQVLINSLVCWFCTSALTLGTCFQNGSVHENDFIITWFRLVFRFWRQLGAGRAAEEPHCGWAASLFHQQPPQLPGKQHLQTHLQKHHVHQLLRLCQGKCTFMDCLSCLEARTSLGACLFFFYMGWFWGDAGITVSSISVRLSFCLFGL